MQCSFYPGFKKYLKTKNVTALKNAVQNLNLPSGNVINGK